MCGSNCPPAADPFGVLMGIFNSLTRQEAAMATVLENLAQIQAKADANGTAAQALASAFADLAADVRAALAAAVNPSVEEQAALDQLSATLDSTSAAAATALADMASLDAEVGDADHSDEPPAPPVDGG